MNSFLELLPNLPIEQWQKLANCEDDSLVEQWLSRGSIPQGPETFALLLSPAANRQLEKLAQKSAALTSQRHGRAIRFYAPLYISNECTNTCTYCGFTMENKITRKTLNDDEIRAELKHLIKRGFRHVLIVSGEHQKTVTPEFVAHMVKICREEFPSISIEVAPFNEKDYKMLSETGVDGLTLYQETYDRDIYKAVHLRGKKKDYNYRVEGPERGAKGSIRRINMGVLLGLTPDWKKDSLVCAAHINFMMKNYWRSQYSISLPRLCPSEADFQPASVTTDRDIVQLVCAYRIAFPDLGINLSTREPVSLRNGLLGLGITHMSAESATDPGGYCNPNESLKQFEITDERPLEQILPVLKEKNLEVVWKDWETCMSG